MMTLALTLGVNKVYIILSHTKNSTKDPLRCDRKRAILVTEGMIESLKEDDPSLSEIEVDIRCMKEHVPEECNKYNVTLQQVCNIRKDAGSPMHMILIVGADREFSYKWIHDHLAKQGVILDTITLDRPEGAMSATSMRDLVLEGEEETFKAFTKANGLSEENAASLYAELRRELKPQVKPQGKRGKSEHPGEPLRKRERRGGKKKRTKRRKRTHKKRKIRTHKKQKRNRYSFKHQS